MFQSRFIYIIGLKIPKGIIRICKSKKDIQHNGQKKNDKQWSTKHTHKTKDQVTQTLQKTGGELRCSGRVICYYSAGGTRQATLHYFMCSGRVNCYCSTGGTRQTTLHSFMSFRRVIVTAPLLAPVRLFYIASGAIVATSGAVTVFPSGAHEVM
jgi:hypothetical protein